MSVPSPQSPPTRRLDVSALSRPVDEQALTRFIAESRANKAPWSRMTTGVRRPKISDLVVQLIVVSIPLAAMLFILHLGGSGLVEAITRFTLDAPFPLNLAIVGFVALVLLGVLIGYLRIAAALLRLRIPRSWWTAAYRLTRFAGDNGLRYGHDESASYPGVIFGTGSDRTIERRFTTTQGRRVEIGNYRYTIASQDRENDRVYGWGYLAITLDRRLPHLLLDAKANNKSVFGIKTSNLPIELATDQKVSLGGEFDEKFTLYAPTEYGRDAFYVFTPDLMALFIDRLGAYDVEIVDDTMFVYGSRFDLLNPRTYEWLQEVVDTVVARTVRRTDRYTDDFAALEAGPQAPDPAGVDPARFDPARFDPAKNPSAFTTFLNLQRAAAGQHPAVGTGRTSDPAAHPPAGDRPAAFEFAGDGPPQLATNTVAAGGRRLRRRRWTVASFVALLFLLFWVYNDLIAPLFGLPRLDSR